MKVVHLKISGIGGIGALELPLNSGVNIFCGPNGIGKTTILECVGHAFSLGSSQLIHRNVRFEKGEIEIHVSHEGNDIRQVIERTSFHPNEPNHIQGLFKHSDFLLSLKSNRFFHYKNLEHLSRDPTKETYQEPLKGISFGDIKNWLAQREMWLPHPNGLTAEQKSNLEDAKNCFNALDPEIHFEKIEPGTFDIIVRTRQGSIYFEYLSSGFKSCICLIIGIIKEIEYRFKNPYIPVSAFEGIVTIDELDAHLHPEWQAKILTILKNVFPRIQFLIATHSPHIIQAAEPNEIIALGFDDAGEVVAIPSVSAAGFQGWTVEEILSDVMGMQDVRTEKYKNLLAEFEDAIEGNNLTQAEEKFKQLDDFLHPSNDLRKLFRFELAQLTAANDD